MHLEKSDQRLISNYGPGKISVDGESYDTMVLVGKTNISTSEFNGPVKELTLEVLLPLLEDKPEILIFGSGKNHHFPTPKLVAELASRGTALETMTTSAACRTYNVLVAEFRDVCAALMPIESDTEAKPTRELQTKVDVTGE